MSTNQRSFDFFDLVRFAKPLHMRLKSNSSDIKHSLDKIKHNLPENKKYEIHYLDQGIEVTRFSIVQVAGHLRAKYPEAFIIGYIRYNKELQEAQITSNTYPSTLTLIFSIIAILVVILGPLRTVNNSLLQILGLSFVGLLIWFISDLFKERNFLHHRLQELLLNSSDDKL